MSPADWPRDLRLRLAVVADVHACDPWTTPDRIRRIVDLANARRPDAVLLLGDYVGDGTRFRPIPDADWAEALAGLAAPLGVHAVLGNHDWWADADAQRRGGLPVRAATALEAVGVPVLHNEVVRLEKDGIPFDLAGLGDQRALLARHGRRRTDGLADLAALRRSRRPGVPAILMAHEPDVFASLEGEDYALTVSGHTHGGQLRPLGRPLAAGTPLGRRYAYGHVEDAGRHLVVSGGVGYARLPLRVGVPSEVTVIDVAAV